MLIRPLSERVNARWFQVSRIAQWLLVPFLLYTALSDGMDILSFVALGLALMLLGALVLERVAARRSRGRAK